MPNRMTSKDDPLSPWQLVPDNLLLCVFSSLQHSDLLHASETCKGWHRVAVDQFLWKDLVYRSFKINASVPMAPGKDSWLEEFKRLYYHTPVTESEVLKEHRDQVLHVSFSHDGKLFATCSKDGFVKVWDSGYPATLLFYEDMKQYTWKYTQYSQFNEMDTLLLVSGVHFGSHSTSGEIAVFNLADGGLEMQCRVLNKPYDIFGTWFNDQYLLSGNLHWLGHLTSCSVLWLNKAYQALHSEYVSVVRRLYKFHNVNASSIRTIMVANCPKAGTTQQCEPSKESQSQDCTVTECSRASKRGRCTKRVQLYTDSQGIHLLDVDPVQAKSTGPIEYSMDYRRAESDRVRSQCDATEYSGNVTPDFVHSEDVRHERESREGSSNTPNDHQEYMEASCSTSPSQTGQYQSDMQDCKYDKLLIFTTGKKTYTPHQIGIKRIHIEAVQGNDLMMTTDAGRNIVEREIEVNNGEEDTDQDFDGIDHLIELHGHIIGMCLSPDQRYLYVNSRPWPQGYQIEDPLYPPPIAQEIDIHVIDLLTMQEVGTMHRAHKAYTPNDECFFIFLDVCDEYVASGAEDKHGYLWDRHYGVCLARFPHKDVVNSVAFNPSDPEMMITASDDHTLKIWRSRNRERGVKGSSRKSNIFPLTTCDTGLVESTDHQLEEATDEL